MLGRACVVLATVLLALACGVRANGMAENDGEGGTSSSGGGPGGGSVPGLGGPSADRGGEPAACASSTVVAEPRPVYLVFMFDRSGSMTESGSPKWSACTAAAKAFFSSTAAGQKKMSASLAFFPRDGDGCDNDPYETPSVAMTPLPSATLVSTLAATSTGGGTPMRHALQGATRYAATVANGIGKDGVVAVVLVTDGLPTGCNNNGLEDVHSVAQGAAAKTPTYVIGVGDLGDLDGIAQAGGTNKALLVPTGNAAQIEQEFLKALEKVQTAAITCDYAIPPPPAGEQLDPAKVNLVHTPAAGPAETLLNDAACASGRGWRYDNPAAPTRVVLCDATCADVKTAAGKIELAFGCATKTAPVK